MTGYSMIPTFHANDTLWVSTHTMIERFDTLAFYGPGHEVQVRRVIALPGEAIAYQGDTLYIDGQPVDERFLVDEVNASQQQGHDYTSDFSFRTGTALAVLPEGSYFVLGDNRPYATDSRQYGLISDANIIEVVNGTLWPLP